MKYRFSFLLVFLLIFNFTLAQGLDEHNKNSIIRNIVSYHFRNALDYDLGLNNNFILNEYRLFFNYLWPTENSNLDLTYSIDTLKYPDHTFKIYRINKSGFLIGNDSIAHHSTLSSFIADVIYLVAINNKSTEIKFISGNFFKSSIAKDFNLKYKDPQSFLYYLFLKTQNWETTNINYLKTRKGNLIFKAFSNVIKQEVIITVDKNNFDNITINQLKKSIVY